MFDSYGEGYISLCFESFVRIFISFLQIVLFFLQIDTPNYLGHLRWLVIIQDRG